MNFDEYVGLPFEERGRGPESYDCWGLFRSIYQERFAIALPSYSESYLTTEDGEALADLMAGNMSPWREIAAGTERVGDGVLMTLGGLPRHVGILCAPGMILHTERTSGSVISRITDPKISRRLVGYFRHERLFDEHTSPRQAGVERNSL